MSTCIYTCVCMYIICIHTYARTYIYIYYTHTYTYTVYLLINIHASSACNVLDKQPASSRNPEASSL